MKKESHGTARYLKKVFTEEGGIKNYEDKIETRGILKFTLFFIAINIVSKGIDKIEDIEIKANTFKHKNKGTI